MMDWDQMIGVAAAIAILALVAYAVGQAVDLLRERIDAKLTDKEEVRLRLAELERRVSELEAL